MDNLNNLKTGLTFDDVLLLPGFADFKREEVDLSTKLTNGISLTLPIISSPMDTVTEKAMAVSMAKNGGLGIIHRNLSPHVEAEMVDGVKKANRDFLVGAALGVGIDFKERLASLIRAKTDILVVDSGHGATKYVVAAIREIKKTTTIPVMAGNIATYEGAKLLIEAGVDILRVGMGPGSICTTRIVTGMGVPQLTAVAEAVRAVKGTNVSVIADGGIRQIGDIAKALAVGADAVMLGSLLAGFDQSPGEVTAVEGRKFKQYRGMGSIAAMKKGGAERYGQRKDTDEKKLVAEGVESLVKYKGDVNDFLYQVRGGLRSSFYYLGGKNLKTFKKKARFVKITESSLRESHPHTVKILNGGGSYL